MPAIFDHHIDDMLTAVMRAIGKEDLKEEATGQKVREALAACWVDTGAVTWTTGDIRGEFPALTRDQARDVLVVLVHQHDASIGISWANLGAYVRRVVPDYDPGREAVVVRSAVEAYAARLVADGNMDSFAAVFGSSDPNFPVTALDSDDLAEIYRDCVLGDDEFAEAP